MFFVLGIFIDIDIGNPVSEIEPLVYSPITLATFIDGTWEKKFELLLQRKAAFRSFLIHKKNEAIFTFFKSVVSPTVMADSKDVFHRIEYLNVLFVEKYTPSEIASWQSDLKEIDSLLQKMHSRLIIVIAPSMENFRKDGLPFVLQAPGPAVRVMQLQEMISSLSQVQFINPYLEFKKLPHPEELYFEKDYHWNQKAGFKIAYNLFKTLALAEVHSVSVEINEPTFEAFQTSELYTLQLLALEEKIKDTEWKISSSFKVPFKIQKPILFLGDSFTNAVSPYFSIFFSDYKYQRKYDFNYDLDVLSAKHWSSVVWIISEEKLNRLNGSEIVNFLGNLK